MNPTKRIEQTLPGLLDEHVEAHPDQPFVLCGDGEWLTYLDVHRRSSQIADGLRADGMTAGDHVAVILPNCEEFLLLIFAFARLGVVQVPINTSLKGEFLRYQLGHSQSTTLVTDSLGIGQIGGIVHELPVLDRVIRVGASDPAEVQLPKQTISDFGSLEQARGAIAAFEPIDPRSTHAIMYTSGTTGLPKGCLISHRYSTSIGRKVGAAGYTLPGDVALSPLPLFHISGQFVLLSQVLAVGCSFVLDPVFSASRMIDRARQVGATNILGLGPMAMAMLAQPPTESDRDHSVRVGMFVPTPADIQNEFKDRFGIEILAEFYAQTEWSPVSICPVSGPRLPGSAGIPAPDVEIRIVDDDDFEVFAGQVGEILARPNIPGIMFDGYFNDPDTTLKTFRNFWHHTGDYGRFDETGHLFYVDRKKDAMRRRGELVSSQELEMAILGHPEVAAVAAIPVPSPLGEDDIKACIVVSEGADVTPESLFHFFRSALPYYAMPRYVEVMAELPTNASHRVMKHKLRESALNEQTWDFESLGLSVRPSERRR